MPDNKSTPEFHSSDDIHWHEATSSLMNELIATKRDLQQKTIELQDALNQVKQLKGLLPICASCKKIRDDKGYWNQIESYIKRHSEAEFSHSICPECAKILNNHQVGAWRSLVAYLNGVQRVGGSNPLAPTNHFNKLAGVRVGW